MKGPGHLFEEAIERSIPRRVYVRKMKTPPPPVPGARIAEYILGLLKSLSWLTRFAVRVAAILREALKGADYNVNDDELWHVRLDSGEMESLRAMSDAYQPPALDVSHEEAELPDWIKAGLYSRYTPSPGYDFLILAPAPFPAGATSAHDALGTALPLDHLHLIGVALELKSVAENRVDFKAVNNDQIGTLAKAEESGLIAGILIEFRKVSEVWFVPLAVWRELQLVGSRQSLPLEDARRKGVQILADEMRGVKLPYWDIAGFLCELGAALPEREERKRKTPEPKIVTANPMAGTLFE